MAKKSTKKQTEEMHRCGECGHGEDILKHNMLNLKGEPICVRCKYSEFARLKSELACEKFKKKIQ